MKQAAQTLRFQRAETTAANANALTSVLGTPRTHYSKRLTKFLIRATQATVSMETKSSIWPAITKSSLKKRQISLHTAASKMRNARRQPSIVSHAHLSPTPLFLFFPTRYQTPFLFCGLLTSAIAATLYLPRLIVQKTLRGVTTRLRASADFMGN